MWQHVCVHLPWGLCKACSCVCASWFSKDLNIPICYILVCHPAIVKIFMNHFNNCQWISTYYCQKLFRTRLLCLCPIFPRLAFTYLFIVAVELWSLLLFSLFPWLKTAKLGNLVMHLFSISRHLATYTECYDRLVCQCGLYQDQNIYTAVSIAKYTFEVKSDCRRFSGSV